VTTVRFSMVVYVLAGVALCDRLVVLGRVASGRCLARSSPLRTQIESHGEWEPLLITRGYHFVYFDGLNRFYVADEHATLDKSFHAPANAFDDFITASAVRPARLPPPSRPSSRYTSSMPPSAGPTQ
jgi:hypothetical protein